MRSLITIGLLISLSANAESFESLLDLAKRQGFKKHDALVQVIFEEAQDAGLKPSKMLRIAMLESSLNVNAWRVNSNQTVDVGLFQINSVNFPKCKDLDLNKTRENIRCAARLLKMHQKYAAKDANWACRYHSKTPSKKVEYCRKLASLN